MMPEDDRTDDPMQDSTEPHPRDVERVQNPGDDQGQQRKCSRYAEAGHPVAIALVGEPPGQQSEHGGKCQAKRSIGWQWRLGRQLKLPSLSARMHESGTRRNMSNVWLAFVAISVRCIIYRKVARRVGMNYQV